MDAPGENKKSALWEALAGSGRGVGVDDEEISGNDVISALETYLSTDHRTLAVFSLAKATVTGRLRLNGLVCRDGGRVALAFNECKFAGAVSIEGADIQSLRIIKCQISGIHGSQLRVRDDITLRSLVPFAGHTADLDFYGCRVEGALRILGDCRFDGSRHPRGSALDLAASRFAGDVILEGPHGDPSARLRCVGGINLQNAEIGGVLYVRGLTAGANDAARFALDLSGARIAHGVSLSASRLYGALRMRNTHVGTFFDLKNTRVRPRRKGDSGESGEAIDASALKVEGDFQVSEGCIFRGRLIFRGARIGATLRFSDFRVELPASQQQAKGEERDFAFEGSELEVGGRMIFLSAPTPLERVQPGLAISLISGGLRLDGAKIGGDLQFDMLQLAHRCAPRSAPVMLSLRNVRISGSLDMRQIDCLQEATIDLTTTVAAVLGGNFKQGWADCQPPRVWLKLDGFRYEALHATKALSGPGAGELVDRRLGLAWVKRQFRGRSLNQVVNLDPYQTLAKSFVQRGDLHAARGILIAGLLREWLCRPVGGQLWRMSWWPVEKLLGVLYWTLFGFGYSAKRAVLTMLACWLIGGLAVQRINHDGVLVIDAMSISAQANIAMLPDDRPHAFQLGPVRAASGVVATSVTPMDRTVPVPHPTDAALPKPPPTADDEVPCGDQINPWVYALDVMVPLLDLRQESRCSVRSSDGFWTLLKAAYAALGAVVVSLGLLTVSGVLRRDLR